MKKTLFLLLTAAVMVFAGCSKKEDTVQVLPQTSSGANTNLLANTGLRTNAAKAAILPDGDYVITNKHSLKVLDLKDFNVNNGGLIQQWQPNLTNGANADVNQVFHFTSLGAGATLYEIEIPIALHRALDVKDHAKANGAAIQIWDFSASANQIWNVTQVNGYYTIQGVEAAKVLDISDKSTANGALVHLWEYTGEDNQLFTITKYVPPRK